MQQSWAILLALPSPKTMTEMKGRAESGYCALIHVNQENWAALVTKFIMAARK